MLCYAVPYSYLTRADFDPEKGTGIYVSNVVILVKWGGT